MGGVRRIYLRLRCAPDTCRMDSQQQIALYLWCAQPLLQCAVAFVMVRRGLRTKFPFFFTYLLVQILIFTATFPLVRSGNYEWFYYVFWVTAAITALLSFKVIHEVFLDVFRPYDTLKDLGTVLFKWAAVVMLLVSVIVAFSSAGAGDPGGNWDKFLTDSVTSLQRSVRLVQCGLILFLLLFSSYLGVSRKQQSFGIALGFGCFAFVELVLLALHSGGYLSSNKMNFVNPAIYDVSIVMWLTYAFARSGSRSGGGTNHLQTQRWEQSLADLHHENEALPPDSLIPMFEGMVERAFSRGSSAHDVADKTPEGEPPPVARAASKNS